MKHLITRSAAGAITAITIALLQGCGGSDNSAPPPPPPLVITAAAPPAGKAGAMYSGYTLTADGGVPPVSWIESGPLPPGIGLTSGALTGTPTRAGTYAFEVTVADSSVPPVKASAPITLQIEDPPIVVAATPAPPVGTVAQPYSPFSFSASGGSPPYTWNATGSLPPGLTVASDGSVSGMPTAGGTYSFSVIATDSAQTSMSGSPRATQITINPPPPTIDATNVPPAGVVAGVYGFTFRETGGYGQLNWSVSAGTMPPGLTLSAGGSLSGMPTQAGSFNFTVTVTDSAPTPQASSVPFTIAVKSNRITGGAALAMAATRRIDVILLSDSNAFHWQPVQDTPYGGSGFAGGFEYALGQKYGLYATGSYGGAFNNSGGLNGYYAAPSGTNLTTTGAGGNAELYEPSGQLPIPWFYSFVSGSPASPGYLAIDSGGAIDVTHALRGHFAYGTFASGSGSFRPGVRSENPPYADIVDAASPISTTDGIGGKLAFASIDVPQGTLTGGANAGNQYSFRAAGPAGGFVATAPFLLYYSRIEDRQASTGASVSVMYGLGGKGMWDYAKAVINAPDLELWMILNEARRLQVQQGLKPVVVLIVNAGVNDRNYTTQIPSWGPLQLNGTASSTANYMDNLAGLMNRIESIYGRYWDLSELSWVIMPSHPQSSPDDPSLLSYRAAVDALATTTPSMTAVDLGNLVTSAQLAANGWYDIQGPPHLSQAGYDQIAAIALSYAILH